MTAASPEAWATEKGFPGASFTTANTTAVMSRSVGTISSSGGRRVSGYVQLTRSALSPSTDARASRLYHFCISFGTHHCVSDGYHVNRPYPARLTRTFWNRLRTATIWLPMKQ